MLRGITPTEVRDLREKVVEGRVLSLPSDRVLYSHDLGYIPPWFRNLLFHPVPACVIQPSSEEELVEVMRYCRAHRIPAITRTAASSGFGNVIPTAGEAVIDVGLLAGVVGFDPSVPSVTVRAGTRWADLDVFLGQRGLTLFTYPSSYYSSVGGWVATGGLGINSLRFGHLKNHVTSLRVVFPNGEAKALSPADAWFDRFFGTEGQLGVITEITLKARVQPQRIYPLLVSFGGEGEAFDWIRDRMEDGAACTHLKFMGGHLVDEVNRFYGEPLIAPRPSVLAVYEDGLGRDQSTVGPGIRAPEHLARFLWHERLFPLRQSREGSSLLASETLLDDGAAPRYVERVRALARRVGFELLVEAHAVAPHRLLLMPHFLCSRDGSFRYLVALVLTSLLTQMAVDDGGVPYGLGIWNSPFVINRFDERSLALLKTWKSEVDPEGLFNPHRYLRVGTRLANLPGQLLRPAIFQFLMKTLEAVSRVWAPLASVVVRSGRAPSKALTSMERAASLCSRCGSCLSVCPAYRVMRDEALTARSKLRLVERILGGGPISPEEVEKAFFCLHCGACERVCQSRLGLVDAWEEMEERLAETYGTPQEAIAQFMRDVSESDEYQRMVDNW